MNVSKCLTYFSIFISASECCIEHFVAQFTNIPCRARCASAGVYPMNASNPDKDEIGFPLDTCNHWNLVLDQIV